MAAFVIQLLYPMSPFRISDSACVLLSISNRLVMSDYFVKVSVYAQQLSAGDDDAFTCGCVENL